MGKTIRKNVDKWNRHFRLTKNKRGNGGMKIILENEWDDSEYLEYEIDSEDEHTEERKKISKMKRKGRKSKGDHLYKDDPRFC